MYNFIILTPNVLFFGFPGNLPPASKYAKFRVSFE